jgi:hypothetical protein
MKKLFDPIANAKTIALLIIIHGAFALLTLPPKLLRSTTADRPAIIIVIVGLLSSLAFIIVGLGLRKVKLWSLYGLLGLTGFSLFSLVITFFQGYAPTGSSTIMTIIYVLVSIWLYSAKDRFSNDLFEIKGFCQTANNTHLEQIS